MFLGQIALLKVADRIQPGLDHGATAQLAGATRAFGVRIETSASIDSIEKKYSGYVAHYRTGARRTSCSAVETIHAFALAIEKHIPEREIAERVYAYPTFHSDLRFLV